MGAAPAPFQGENAHLLSASEACRRIADGDLTVVQYATALLRRIHQRDEQVRAWAYLDTKYVMQQAQRLDEVPMGDRGPLHGMPIGIKDVMYTKDMPTQFNSPAYANHHVDVDAAPIKILRAQGALLLGKTATTEFAATAEGPATRNPHDPSRTPGGSSSGSGAAVGDFQVPVALGTQTGGSVIRPACFNGVYGLKPTWGRVSREGLKFFSVTYDTIGFFTRSVDDLAMLLTAFGIDDDEEEDGPPDAVSALPQQQGIPRSLFSTAGVVPSVRGLRLAFFRTMMWPHAGPGTRAAVDTALALLRRGGATVDDVELPADFDPLPRWYDVILAREGGAAFRPEYEANPQHLGALLVGYAQNREGHTNAQYLAAVDGVAALRPRIDKLLSAYDAALTPSAPDEAPPGNATGSYLFCKLWSALHVPVLNVPGFAGENGMPIGLSMVAPRFRDARLVGVARAVGGLFESEGGWRRVPGRGKRVVNGNGMNGEM